MKPLLTVPLLCMLALHIIAPAPVYAQGKTPPERSITFPWGENVSAAIFTRSNMLWVVFDQAQPFDTQKLIAESKAIFTRVEAIPNPHYSILRIEMNNPHKIQAQKSGLNWVVSALTNTNPVIDPVQVESLNKPPALPHIFLGLGQRGVRPIRITDPDIGDELLIIPLTKPRSGVLEARRYVDFEMLPTSQGIALQLFTDEIKLYPMDTSLKLITPSMELASQAPSDVTTIQPSVIRAMEIPSTIFPFNEWSSDDPAMFTYDLSMLEQEVLDAPPETRTARRLQLAKFLIANRFGLEAMGLLDIIRDTNKTFAATPDVKLTSGLAAFISHRYPEAQKFFASVPTLQDKAKQQEVDFWKQAVSAKLNTILKVPPFYLEHKDGFVSRYPLWLRQDLALTAAEQHIKSDDLSIADQTLASLISLNIDGKITNDITYLRGLFAAHHNQADNAISQWENLINDPLDRYNRTRAQLATVELLLREGKIDVAEGIKRLNTIRMSWRGDELERNILKILGQLYINEGNYREGLQVWREIVANFPNTPDALYVATKMTQTFIYLFNQGGTRNLSPLTALDLYYEFNELTPIGEQRDLMVQNIANRLFAVDLLDQAAILLTHQVRYRLKGEEKIRVGTKLAMLHLWNKKPERALEVLDALAAEGHFPGVGIRREYLRAQALSDLKRYTKALKVLEHDDSEDAKEIKQDIYWRMERWDRVAVILMPKFRRLFYKPRPLTHTETDQLLRLATVYTFQHKKYALHKLYQDFKNRIPDDMPSYKENFDFLAGNLDAIDYRNIAGTLQLGSYQGFLEKYHNYAKTEGLDALDKPIEEAPAMDNSPEAPDSDT